MVQLVEMMALKTPSPVQVNPHREVGRQVYLNPRQRTHHLVVISKCLLKRILEAATGHMSVEDVTITCLADQCLNYRRSFGSSRAGGNDLMTMKLN